MGRENEGLGSLQSISDKNLLYQENLENFVLFLSQPHGH